MRTLLKSIAFTVAAAVAGTAFGYELSGGNLLLVEGWDEVTLFDEHPEWGYKVEGLGAGHDEMALVFTNQNAASMAWQQATTIRKTTR